MDDDMEVMLIIFKSDGLNGEGSPIHHPHLIMTFDLPTDDVREEAPNFLQRILGIGIKSAPIPDVVLDVVDRFYSDHSHDDYCCQAVTACLKGQVEELIKDDPVLISAYDQGQAFKADALAG